MSFMNPTLYFLRSSEQKIATDMLRYAARLDEVGKTLDEIPELAIYERHYGLTHKDLGLYALAGHELVGAAWIRLFAERDGANAFVDETTPVLTVGVKPQFRSRGIGSAMLEQLLLEAGALYEQISVSVLEDSHAVPFYEKFGFTRLEGSQKISPVDGQIAITLLKQLERKTVQRPSEGYDPTYWMD